jgi:hypothetical protein
MAVAAVIAGCLGGDEEAPPATGAPRALAEVVQRLERATAAGDFETVCNDLFTAAARARAGGEDCVRLTSSAAAGVARPRIDVRAIELQGATARVRVESRARGQAVVSDVLLLRREGGRWRVEALGG